MSSTAASVKEDFCGIHTKVPPVRSELLQASDEQIEHALTFADPMALRGLIFQLTGDEEIAATRVEKKRVFFADAFVPATPEDVASIRRKAADFLKAYRDSGAKAIEPGPVERLPRSLTLAAGQEISDSQITMWIEETALDPWARALTWPEAPQPERLHDFKVAVIGAGLGGIGAAVQLKRAGIPYVVIEKNAAVGGTWFENRYPGARVDTPSRAYTHIFGADFVFDYAFSPQKDNEAYFNAMADRYNIREDIIFNTEVSTMSWQEDSQTWKIDAHSLSGSRTFEVNSIICASGLLARPNLPEIPGRETFAGKSFHTASWPQDLDLADKRVAVVGTGATGYQMVPELAKVAKHVTLFQRKPQWIFPIPGYLSPLPAEVTWLDRNLPYHVNFMRFRTNWLTGEHVYADIFSIDPTWNDPDHYSALNRDVRDGRLSYIREKFKDRPDLAESMVPPHPPFSARPILVDADYNIYDAILRENVTLITSGIERVIEDGLVAAGQHHAADVIVFATGFRANDLLFPMRITGRGGVSVEELWSKDGCRAHVSGSMIPELPNFFMLYGPNTNPAQGGGIVNHEEMVTRFALECMAKLILDGTKSVTVTDSAFQLYNDKLDQRESQKIYTDHRARNFYMNKSGRSSVMCPFAPSELWQMLSDAHREDLVFQ